ncbi:hypothetical protein [Streptomyces tendae]|uniref:hypothetical protein n=1 Tax=Streptomyces tendae TaxID=1932 RepID=UPI0037124A05
MASVLAVGVAVGGVGDDSAPETVSPRPAAANAVDESEWPHSVPERGLAKGLTLPVEKYLVSYPEVVQWQRARRGVWVSCMARYGFEEFNPPVPGLNPPTEYNDANMSRRYGISDAALAAKYGYHLSPEVMVEPPVWEPAPGAEEAVFSGEGQEVGDGTYNGKAIPDGGCRGEAERELGQPPRSETASQVEMTALKESMDDPTVQAVVAKWSSCMKAEGYSVAHPYRAADQFNTSTGTASPEEIALATADVACKEETSLISVWHGVESGREQAVVAKQRTKLDAELAKKNSLMTSARRTMSEK